MRKLWCHWFGHDNVWTLDPLAPGEFIVVCLNCRDRAYSTRHLTPTTQAPHEAPATPEEGR